MFLLYHKIYHLTWKEYNKISKPVVYDKTFHINDKSSWPYYELFEYGRQTVCWNVFDIHKICIYIYQELFHEQLQNGARRSVRSKILADNVYMEKVPYQTL